MQARLELHARPMSHAEPVICIDEKSLHLIGHSRAPLPMDSRGPEKVGYEHVRNGTTNLFVAVEPKAGQRIVLGDRAPGKVRLRRIGRQLADQRIDQRSPSSPGSGRPEHRLRKVLRRRFGRARSDQILAPSSIPLHAQARELAEHGRDRDRHPQPATS
jgi:hypothetical protein